MENYSKLGFSGEEKQIQIKAENEDLKGVYANLMQITHTQEEFVLDFFFVVPPQGTIVSRVIMSPTHFKRMVRNAFADNLKKYEEKFGGINEEKKDDESTTKRE